MQNQLQSSFDMIATKMTEMEQRISRADEELQTQTQQQEKLQAAKAQAEQENMRLF